MDASLRVFICQFVGVVAAALIPAIVVAFLTIPYTLGGHPGEPRPAIEVAGQHMT